MCLSEPLVLSVVNREGTQKKQSQEEKASLQQSVQKSSALITERDKELVKLRDEVKHHTLNKKEEIIRLFSFLSVVTFAFCVYSCVGHNHFLSMHICFVSVHPS